MNRLSVLLFSIAAAGCGTGPEERADNAAGNVLIEIETLPPDESVATPTNELRNGFAEPHVNEATLNGS